MTITAADVDRAIDEHMRNKNRLAHAGGGAILVPEDARKAQREKQVASDVARILLQHYPGHRWRISVDVDRVSGLVLINILHKNMDGMFGYSIRTDKMFIDPKLVIRGAGELLERWGLTRGKAKETELAAVKRNFDGTACHEN